MTAIRYDLHLHTEYSPDCDTAVSDIEAHCLALGLTGIAVTDHDTITGAVKLRDSVKNLHVIVGEEVTSSDGDIIGLFLHERIPPGMSGTNTIRAIHDQGGLVYLPHPFDRTRVRRTGGASLSSIIDGVDIVEAFNGKVGQDSYNTMAAEYAQRNNKREAGGSDAHSLRAIGTVTNEFTLPDGLSPALMTPDIFLNALHTNLICGRRRSKIGGVFIIGRRPFSLAWRRLRRRKNGS